LREFSRRWLLANLEVRSSAIFEILFSVLFLATLASLFLSGNITAINAFIGIAAMNVVALIAWWKFYGAGFSISRVGASEQLGKNFRYGRWAAAENFCSSITMFFCVWYLNRQMGLTEGGVYSACFNVMLLANPFLLGVCSLLGARAAQEYANGGWDAMLKTLTQYGVFIFVVLSLFAIVLWFFGAELTNLMFSDKYQVWFDANLGGINRVTSILGLAIPFLGISFVLSAALLSIGRPQDNFLCAFVSLAVLLAINWTLGPSLQIAAISFVAASAANAGLRMLCLLRSWRSRKVAGAA
jgi:O-antigen/teichoic acid export membrane protein